MIFLRYPSGGGQNGGHCNKQCSNEVVNKRSVGALFTYRWKFELDPNVGWNKMERQVGMAVTSSYGG